MGFLSGMLGSVVKVALTPVAVVVDVVNVATGSNVDATKGLIKSAGHDVEDAFEDLADGELL